MTRTFVLAGQSNISNGIHAQGGTPTPLSGTRLYRHNGATSGATGSWVTPTGWLGITLANELKTRLGEDIDLVDISLEGATLQEAFDNNKWYLDSDTNSSFLQNLKDALDDTGNTYDGIIWLQGEGEFQSGMTASPATSKRNYYKALTRLWERGLFATHTNQPPIMICLINETVGSASSAHIEAIRDAQIEWALDHDFACMGADLTDATLSGDNIHYAQSSAGYGKVAELIAERVENALLLQTIPRLYQNFTQAMFKWANVSSSPSINSTGWNFDATSGDYYDIPLSNLGFAQEEGTLQIRLNPDYASGGVGAAYITIDNNSDDTGIRVKRFNGTSKVRTMTIKDTVADTKLESVVEVTSAETITYTWNRSVRKLWVGATEYSQAFDIELADYTHLRIGRDGSDNGSSHLVANIEYFKWFDKYITSLTEIS